jgi:riboflavin transporter FmnP
MAITQKRAKLESKPIAFTITFSAIAIALNAVKIPSIFYPNTTFQFAQIPIIVAFLTFGVKIGVLVGALNLLAALFLFPLPNGLIVYPMDFVSLSIMFLGLYIGSRLTKGRNESEIPGFRKKTMIGFTAIAAAFRVGLMLPVDYWLISHVLLPAIYGIRLPEAIILSLLPAFIAYNAIVALYTVPIAYVIAKSLVRFLKIEPRPLK